MGDALNITCRVFPPSSICLNPSVLPHCPLKYEVYMTPKEVASEEPKNKQVVFSTLEFKCLHPEVRQDTETFIQSDH